MKQQFRLFVVTTIFAGAAFFLLKDMNSCQTNQLYSGLIGNILATFFAAFLVWIAWEQWSNINKTSSADFIHRLTKDFFTTEARRLISLIECKAIVFKAPQSIPDSEIGCDGIFVSQGYFEVNLSTLKKAHLPDEIVNEVAARKYYSLWEIDDILLSPLEDVGMLEEKGIVDFGMVHSGFSYYLSVVWGCEEIKKYINFMREDNQPGFDRSEKLYYGASQSITQKCEEFDALHTGLCKWWWIFKRQFCGIQPQIKSKLVI